MFTLDFILLFVLCFYFYFSQSKNLCAHPYLEIYDGDTIHFLAPLAKQDEFYVPEALEEEVEVTPEPELKGEGDRKAKRKEEKKKEKKKNNEEEAAKRSVLNAAAATGDGNVIPDDKVKQTSRRSMSTLSTLSFKTAKEEVVNYDKEETLLSQSVAKIKLQLDKSTPEGVQDSGISSTSSGSSKQTITPVDSADTVSISSSAAGSSSNLGSSSLESISSLNSSCTSYSGSSFTSYSGSSFTGESSYTEESTAENSLEFSTEVSKEDLNEPSNAPPSVPTSKE